jgi:hypothetical protein
MSQGCHTCNQTDQKPEVTPSAVRFFLNASDKNFSEWAMSRGPNTFHFAVEMALWLHRSVVNTTEGGPGSKKVMQSHI